jgi:hypothetical protein
MLFRYLQYLKSFDLSTGFYFSDTYDLTNTFQTNVVSLINDEKAEFPFRAYNSLPCDPIRTHNEYFMWNYFIIEEFFKLLKNKRWVTSFIYGFIEQISKHYILKQRMISFYRGPETSFSISNCFDFQKSSASCWNKISYQRSERFRKRVYLISHVYVI